MALAVFEWLRRFAIWRGQELWDWIPCTRYGASAEACEHVRPYGSPRDDMRNTRTPNFEQQEHHAERHAIPKIEAPTKCPSSYLRCPTSRHGLVAVGIHSDQLERKREREREKKKKREEGERGERKKREIGSDGERKKAGKPKH